MLNLLPGLHVQMLISCNLNTKLHPILRDPIQSIIYTLVNTISLPIRLLFVSRTRKRPEL